MSWYKQNRVLLSSKNVVKLIKEETFNNHCCYWCCYVLQGFYYSYISFQKKKNTTYSFPFVFLLHQIGCKWHFIFFLSISSSLIITFDFFHQQVHFIIRYCAYFWPNHMSYFKSFLMFLCILIKKKIECYTLNRKKKKKELHRCFVVVGFFFII